MFYKNLWPVFSLWIQIKKALLPAPKRTNKYCRTGNVVAMPVRYKNMG